MICPKCQSAKTYKRGTGRGGCWGCGRTFKWDAAAHADEVMQVRHGNAPEHGLAVPTKH